MKCIKYKKGYKYQLNSEYDSYIPVRPDTDILTEYIRLFKNGRLIIDRGYAWDGPSGPTIDTKNFMRGSLVHDALYQLIRMELLPQDKRSHADDLLQKMCKEDGMSSIRAWWVRLGVGLGGAAAADPKNLKEVYSAPKEC